MVVDLSGMNKIVFVDRPRRVAMVEPGVTFGQLIPAAEKEGIRLNMERESGMTEAAIRERSSIFYMKQLKAPVLILHGDKDENVPVSQAYLLRDRLTELKKDFEIQIFPGLPNLLTLKKRCSFTVTAFVAQWAETLQVLHHGTAFKKSRPNLMAVKRRGLRLFRKDEDAIFHHILFSVRLL